MSSNTSIYNYNIGRIASRDSNIELLRIICMVMVIAHHLVLHGGILENSIGNTANLILGELLLPAGKIGYDCFIVITTWFCAGKEFKGSKFVKIALQVIFYNFIGMFLASILNNGQIEPITIRNWIGVFFPVFGISHGFAVYYMIFLMILPLLNVAAEKMNKKNIQSIIVLAFLMQIWQKVFNYLIDFKPFVDLDNGLFTFIILFFATVYIKKYPMKICSNKVIIMIVFIFVYSINAFVNISSAISGNTLFSLATIVLNNDDSPLNMIAGFCLFFVFKEIKIKHNNIINFVASHTFGILLLHDHNYFRYIIWENVFFINKFYDVEFPVLFGYIFIVVFIIFTVGIIVDTIFELLFEKPLIRIPIYSKICNRLENCFKLQSSKGDD